jgi:tellurium resistance protein TerD
MSEAPKIEEQKIAADSLHMKKGEEVNLTQAAPALRRVRVGLGWSAPSENDGFPVDIDACAFLLNHAGRVRQDTDFIFYNNLESDGVQHSGDNRTGEGEGDDEMIHLNLDKIPFDVDSVAFSVTIHNSGDRQQNFGIVKGAFIRIVNEEDGKELAHFDLSEDASTDDAVVFGEMIRDIAGWKFRALGRGCKGGLYQIARDFGVNVAAA